MKVIVCGTGQVGFNIARYLALEGNDITVIDQRADLVRRISDTLDVQGIVGHASHPNILEQAGAEDADMIIAVTHGDEVNMVACQIAHSIFDVPTKIARVRDQSYLQPIWANLVYPGPYADRRHHLAGNRGGPRRDPPPSGTWGVRDDSSRRRQGEIARRAL